MFVTATGKDGVARIHRATCKRLPAKWEPIEEAPAAVDIASGDAKAAGCCKPRPSLEAASVEPEDTDIYGCTACGIWTDNEAALEEHMLHHDDETGEWLGEEAAAVKTAWYSGPKHYWRALGRRAGLTIAERYGVTVTADNRARSITLSGLEKDVLAAEQNLLAAWTRAMDQFRVEGGLKGMWPDLPHGEAYAAAQDWLHDAALAVPEAK